MGNCVTCTPYIRTNQYGAAELCVHNKPFLMLGGELHNSASSNLDFMEREVWPYIRPLGLNTIILPVAWESIEPEEGQFTFELVDGLIEQARREQVKLVVLWFGLWKNGESFYVPSWVKEDYKTYFRSRYADGHPSNTVSPFCEEAVEADRRAFVRLMAFLKEKDEKEQTVIMVQVENEIGFLGAERDFSPEAERAYKKEIPDALKDLYHTDGDWYTAFGEDAPEYFMAWQYGQDVQRIAAAGKEVYPLPMYVNTWLDHHPARPGIYPSGGPVAKLIPLWQAAAPAIDLVAPDIYHPDFKGVCEEFCISGNPLFVPEARRDPITASNMFFAFGGLNALGYSPFAVEDFLRSDLKGMDMELLESLNIDRSGFDPVGTAPYFMQSCKVLSGLLPLITEKRGSKEMIGFIRYTPLERGCIIPMDGYDLQLDYTSNGEKRPGSAGIIFPVENGFYISGCNVKFRVYPKIGSGNYVTVVRLEEGMFADGSWKPERVLNGDEQSETYLGDMAATKFVKLCVHTV